MTTLKDRLLLLLLTIWVGFVLSSCSSIQLAYNQSDYLLKWWLDDYINLTDEQEKIFDQALPLLTKKHRQEELPKSRQGLQQIRHKLDQAISEEDAILVVQKVKFLSKESIYLAQDDLAKLAVTLHPKQLVHLENTFNKLNKKFQSDYLKGSPEDRLNKRVEKIIERTESFSGDLSKSQKLQLKEIAKENLLDMQLVYEARLYKQQLILNSLRKISSEQPSIVQTKAILTQLFNDIEFGTTPEQKEFEKKRDVRSGIILAKTTALFNQSQRKKTQEKIKSWEDDLQVLAQQKAKD